MITISFDVKGQSLFRTDDQELATDSINAVEAVFTFDETWNGLFKFAEFSINDTRIVAPISSGKVNIPAEALVNPGVLYVGVRGINGEETSRLTTVKRSHVIVKSSTYTPDYSPAEPHSYDDFEQLFIEYAAEARGYQIDHISVTGTTLTITYLNRTTKSATIDLSAYQTKSEATATYQTLGNLINTFTSGITRSDKYPSEHAVAEYVAQEISEKADADEVYTTEEVDGIVSTIYNNVSNTYVKKDQGEDNAGKYLAVASTGNVVPTTPPLTSWNNIPGKPDTFTPSAHTHTGAEVSIDTTESTFIDGDNAQEVFDSIDSELDLLSRAVETKQDLTSMKQNMAYSGEIAQGFYPSIYAVKNYVDEKIGDINSALEALL